MHRDIRKETIMSNQKFKDGDVVKLNSGGPKMTVKKYGLVGDSEELGYKCVFYNQVERRFESELFREYMLMNASKSKV